MEAQWATPEELTGMYTNAFVSFTEPDVGAMQIKHCNMVWKSCYIR